MFFGGGSILFCCFTFTVRVYNYTAQAGEHCVVHGATQFTTAVRLRSAGAAAKAMPVRISIMFAARSNAGEATGAWSGWWIQHRVAHN